MTKAAFTGEIEFELTIGMFNESVVRSAAITYAYTPTWPYYDVAMKAEKVGQPTFELGLQLLAERQFSMPGKKPVQRWLRCTQILSAGALGAAAYDKVSVLIDLRAQNADRINRVYAGVAVPPYAVLH